MGTRRTTGERAIDSTLYVYKFEYVLFLILYIFFEMTVLFYLIEM